MPSTLVRSPVRRRAARSAADPGVPEDLRDGDGGTTHPGSTLTLDYTGWLYDVSRPHGKGREFEDNSEFVVELGRGLVIHGWEEGLVGMRANGERRLIVPPELAYGAVGRRPRVPPHATLVYDIILKRVH